MKTNILILSLLITLFTVSISSCMKDPQQNSHIPELPPIESMSLPTDGFMLKSLVNNQQSHVWFDVSALTVGVWNSVIAYTLAVPVLSFKEAINNQRLQISDNLWRWTYNTTVLSDVYTTELEASYNGELVIWEMYISKTGNNPFSRFRWATGNSLQDGTNGSWVIYKSPIENTAWYEIVWHKSYIDAKSDIVYTNVSTNDINKGSYIKYEKSTDSNYDATYTIFGNIDNKTIAIKWNSKTTYGNITVSKDGAVDGPHCWDSNKLDLLTCPN